MESYPEECYEENYRALGEIQKEMSDKAREVWTATPKSPGEISRIQIKAKLFDVILERHPNILKDIFNEVSNHE